MKIKEKVFNQKFLEKWHPISLRESNMLDECLDLTLAEVRKVIDEWFDKLEDETEDGEDMAATTLLTGNKVLYDEDLDKLKQKLGGDLR